MTDVSVKMENFKFNYRVSVIIRRGNQVLVHHDTDENIITLPGGRVQIGEQTKDAIVRELKEEIGSEIEILKDVSFLENFFDVPELKYHEILLTFEGKFKDESLYLKEKFEPMEDEKKGKLEFCWKDINSLSNQNFVPNKLISVIENSNEMRHLVDEREFYRN